MSEAEVLWRSEQTTDFLADIRAFTASLDRWQILIDLRTSAAKRLVLSDGTYRLEVSDCPGAFQCPHCSATEFEVMEGSHSDQAVLGLACLACNTYGVVFPSGL